MRKPHGRFIDFHLRFVFSDVFDVVSNETKLPGLSGWAWCWCALATLTARRRSRLLLKILRVVIRHEVHGVHLVFHFRVRLIQDRDILLRLPDSEDRVRHGVAKLSIDLVLSGDGQQRNRARQIWVTGIVIRRK